MQGCSLREIERKIRWSVGSDHSKTAVRLEKKRKLIIHSASLTIHSASPKIKGRQVKKMDKAPRKQLAALLRLA
jgi:hypothetical protein